jgi:hypothetical protein
MEGVMTDIDRKVAEWVGYNATRLEQNILASMPKNTIRNIGEEKVSKHIHAWLLSPPGTVAILEALGKIGYYAPYYHDGDKEWQIWEWGVDQRLHLITRSPDLPTAVLSVARVYMEGK